MSEHHFQPTDTQYRVPQGAILGPELSPTKVKRLDGSVSTTHSFLGQIAISDHVNSAKSGHSFIINWGVPSAALRRAADISCAP